jgi:RNA polymerase sigma-70 factor (ECF subfamily)
VGALRRSAQCARRRRGPTHWLQNYPQVVCVTLCGEPPVAVSEGNHMPAEPNPTSTLGLLERIRAGDESAFSVLFRKYSPRLSVLIHYKLSPEMRSRVEADDILQEAFFFASRQLGSFTYRNPGSFMSWISRIADHIVVDAARRDGRQKRRPAELVRLRTESNPQGAEAVDSSTPSRILARKERLEQVLRRLDSLPEDYRQVILLAKIEGLSTGEISERLGKSRENVAVLLHRAIQRLRELEKGTGQG